MPLSSFSTPSEIFKSFKAAMEAIAESSEPWKIIDYDLAINRAPVNSKEKKQLREIAKKLRDEIYAREYQKYLAQHMLGQMPIDEVARAAEYLGRYEQSKAEEETKLKHAAAQMQNSQSLAQAYQMYPLEQKKA
jgi:light-regulated signal transduction histidine kinase (bacteriophytochrome)